MIGGVLACAPVSWMVEIPVKLPWTKASVPWRIGMSSLTSIRTRTLLGSSGHSSISFTSPAGTPENETGDPFASPSTLCGKKMSYCRFDPSLICASQTMNRPSAASNASVTAPTQM